MIRVKLADSFFEVMKNSLLKLLFRVLNFGFPLILLGVQKLLKTF